MRSGEMSLPDAPMPSQQARLGILVVEFKGRYDMIASLPLLATQVLHKTLRWLLPISWKLLDHHLGVAGT